jgi:hypothetical protein
MMAKAERADKDAWRIVVDGAVVALVLRMGSGRWAPFDANGEQRLNTISFDKPSEAAKWWDTRGTTTTD